MRFLDRLKAAIRPRSELVEQQSLNPEEFIYVKIPGNIQPVQRGEQFEDRIDPVLSARRLGSVSGGGSSLADPLPDGRRLVEFCGLDIDTEDRDGALEALRDVLPQIGAPTGTELRYTRDGAKLQDEFDGLVWSTNKPRLFLHPGFDI